MDSLFRSGAIFIGFAIIFQVTYVKSERIRQCKDHNITITDEDLAGLEKCTKAIELKSLDEITMTKLPCFIKCMMHTFGMVDEFGKPHRENMMKDINREVIPEDTKDLYKKDMEKCIDDHGRKITAGEPNCESYGPLAMCIINSVASICFGI